MNNSEIEDVLSKLDGWAKTSRSKGRTLEQAAALIRKLRDKLDLNDDGRLVLPCKVGDTVWANFCIAGSYLREKNKPYACTVLFVGLNQGGGFINFEYQKGGSQFQLDFNKIGKSVFLTREEAESALEEE